MRRKFPKLQRIETCSRCGQDFQGAAKTSK